MKPPKDLSKSARAIWKKVVTHWELDESGLILLEKACRCHDDGLRAEETINRLGLVIATKDGFKKNPAAEVLATSRANFARFWRMLHLDVEQNGDGPGRPCQSSMKGGYCDE